MVWIYFVLLSIFVIGSEASQNRFFDMKYGERFRTIRPIVIGEANYSRQYDCSINKGLEYIFEFSNKEVSSSLPARITVESISSNRSYPVLIVVRQQKGVLSWQLPLVVEIQSTTFEYVRTSRTLCPDNNYYMPYHTNGGNSNDVVVSLSTASPVNVSFSLRVNLERDFLLSGGHSGFGYITYITKCTSKHHCTQPCDILPEPTGCLSLSGAIPGLLKDISGVKSKDNLSHSVPSLTALVFIESIAKQFMRELRNISVSPAEPRYYSFKFEDDVETVVLRVDSNDDICMTVSIQNMSCPVFDLERNVQFEGYWQTMNRRGGITLTRSAFPMGFYVVFVVKGDDADCSGLFETVTTTRNKTITFSVSRSIGYQKYIISTIGALTVFVLFYVFSIVISIMYFIRCRGQVSETGLLDDASFVSPLSPPPTSYDQIQTPSRSSEVTSPRLPRRHSDSSLDETDIDMLHDADSDKDVFRMFGIKSEEKEVEDAETDVSFVEITPILDEGSSAVEFSLPQHQRCAAHLLNLIATKDSQKAEEDAIFKKIARSSFALCQALWNKQRSTVATDSVHEKFQKLLVTPNATRWNSMYNSVKCLVSVVETSGSAELDALMDSLGLQHFRPSQLTFLKEYIVVMKPVAVALNILQAEKNMYIGYLLPTIKCLLRDLNKKASNSSLNYCRPLAKALVEGTENRFGATMKDRQLIIAAGLIPALKFSWLDGDEREEAIALLKQEVLSRYEMAEMVGSGCTRESAELSDEENFFSTCVAAEPSPLLDEVLSYLSSTSKSINLMLQYKSLLSMFFSFNCGIPSSAPVERLFSQAKDVLSPKRSRLSDTNFKMQLFCKVNAKVLDQ